MQKILFSLMLILGLSMGMALAQSPTPSPTVDSSFLTATAVIVGATATQQYYMDTRATLGTPYPPTLTPQPTSIPYTYYYPEEDYEDEDATRNYLCLGILGMSVNLFMVVGMVRLFRTNG